MKPPPAFGIGFQTIDEPMAILVQDETKPVTKIVEYQFLGSTSFSRRPPVGRLLAIGLHRKRVGRKPDGYGNLPAGV